MAERPRVCGGAHLVLVDELLDPRVDRLGHPHGGRAGHDARVRRQLQRGGRVEEARGEEERSHGESGDRGGEKRNIFILLLPSLKDKETSIISKR